MMKHRLVLSVVLLAFGVVAQGVADEPDRDVSALIKELTARLEAQDRKISQLEGKLTDDALQAARHEEIAKIMSEMRADASQRGAMPKWLDDLKFFGDLRLRFEHHSADGVQLRERNRYRFRLRFGFIKTWLDKQLEVGFRLASGNNTSPQSTNQTFTGGFGKKSIWIDRAYAKYSPNAVPGLTVIGGKIPNVLEHTDLIFDSDLNPEGLGVMYHRELCKIDFFGTFAHLLAREGRGGHDTVLNVYQGGIRAPLPCGAKATVAATWYDFENYEDLGVAANSWNRSTRMMNLLAKVKFKALGLPWQVYVDWVHNSMDHDPDPRFSNSDDGYAFGVKVGTNKKQGDWSAGYQYKYIEMNATPAMLNDSDFGGTNLKGHVFKAKYSVTDFLTAGGAVFLTRPIEATGDRNDFLFQFDLAWKF